MKFKVLYDRDKKNAALWIANKLHDPREKIVALRFRFFRSALRIFYKDHKLVPKFDMIRYSKKRSEWREPKYLYRIVEIKNNKLLILNKKGVYSTIDLWKWR